MTLPLCLTDHLMAVVAAAHHRFPLRFTWSAQPILALVAGVFILIRPKLLNMIVAVYLILAGLMGICHLPW